MEYTVVVGSDPLAGIVEQPVYLHAGKSKSCAAWICLRVRRQGRPQKTDSREARRSKSPFIDVGMGIELTENALARYTARWKCTQQERPRRR
jgi:hypothetical protein